MQNKIPTRRSNWSSWSAYLIVAFVAAALLALTGCEQKGVLDGPQAELVVYKDTNGCEYVRPLGYAGIAPRLNRDGKQICR